MTTASKVTMLRIFMIPVFVVFFMLGYYNAGQWPQITAIILFVLAAATDGVDGHIARKYNQVTDFGKFIDPLADKILVISALICMVEFKYISAVAVIIIIAREFMVTGLRISAISAGKVIAAAMSGKIKTVIQLVVSTAVMLAYAFGVNDILWIDISLEVGIWIMVVITIYSGCEYMVKNWNVIDFKK